MIFAPAYVVAPNGATPSVGTPLTTKVDMFPFNFLWLPMTL